MYNILMFLCCFLYLLTVNWQMVLTCAICIPITFILTKKLVNPTYKMREQFEDKMDEIDIMAKDTIMNQKIEKMFQLQNIRREKFDKTMDEATEYYVEYERLVAKASPVKYLLNAAPTLICIMVGFINSYQGKITSGEFVSVVLLLEYISKPLSEFLTYITDYKTAQVSMERVLEKLRDEIAYVEQTPYLFDGTIEENIKAGNQNATREDVIRAAKQAYAHHFIMELENGYEAKVREGGKNLSGGQRQRIAIASYKE